MSKKISVFGLGYVGVVSAACFAKDGHTVIGVDVSREKVDLINQGISPIIEDEIGELVKNAVENGRLKAVTDPILGVVDIDLIFVCVGTPSAKNGSLDTGYINKVCEDLGSLLKNASKIPTIVIRSTLLPGTMENLVIPAIEKTLGESVMGKVKVLFHPEFLREGSSVYDFNFPPKIVIGESTGGGSSDLLALYNNIEAPRFVVSYKVAEMVKYCDNMFHALKVTFANEIGQFCKNSYIDSHEVMNIFTSDVKLNISSKYLKPGFAFGGSCLPKDLRAFTHLANIMDIKLPMLNSILVSNKRLIEEVAWEITNMNCRSIGLFGLSFKKGTDDLRESPLVSLCEILIGKGFEIKIYDEYVNLARLIGGNKSYINEKLPHISDLLVEQVNDLVKSEVIILGHSAPNDVLNHWVSLGKKIIDLNHPGIGFK